MYFRNIPFLTFFVALNTLLFGNDLLTGPSLSPFEFPQKQITTQGFTWSSSLQRRVQDLRSEGGEASRGGGTRRACVTVRVAILAPARTPAEGLWNPRQTCTQGCFTWKVSYRGLRGCCLVWGCRQPVVCASPQQNLQVCWGGGQAGGHGKARGRAQTTGGLSAPRSRLWQDLPGKWGQTCKINLPRRGHVIKTLCEGFSSAVWLQILDSFAHSRELPAPTRKERVDKRSVETSSQHEHKMGTLGALRGLQCAEGLLVQLTYVQRTTFAVVLWDYEKWEPISASRIWRSFLHVGIRVS